MREVPDSAIVDMLGRLSLTARERGEFARSDNEATLNKVRLLTAAAMYFNAFAVREFGGRAGSIRARGLGEQIVGAAFQTYAGVDPHPEPFDKAAMLLRGITQGHPFNDGNKRTGFLLAAYYLDIVGFPIVAFFRVDAAVAFCLSVSAGEIREVPLMAREIARLWQEDK